VLLEQAGRQLRLFGGQLRQIAAQIGDHLHHPGENGTGISGTFQVPVLAIHDLGPYQLVSDLRGAPEADLDQVAPAAAHLPQRGPGPVADEDRLPLPGDELLPAEQLRLIVIVVIHEPQITAALSPRRAARPPGVRRVARTRSRV
jgi:hypothetical protein